MLSMNRYVEITSGVGGGAAVPFRDLIARIFTENQLLPTGTIMEFANADDVATYFGGSSTEYKMAAQYFGWISKSITRAKKISFGRWANVDTAPQIFGVSATYALATFTGISNGTLRLTLGATTNDLTGLNFTAAASLADVATVIQTAINAESGGMWTGATVAYDATNKRFTLTGGATGAAVVTVADTGGGTAIRTLIGWGTGAILSNGAAAQSIATLLVDSTALSNNFGSFMFIPTLSNDEIVEAATWNDAQNNMFLYSVAPLAANAATLSALVIGYSGIGLTLDPGISNQYPVLIPATILAATDYTRPAAAKNFMYQEFPTLAVAVSDDTTADGYDAERVNYIGVTQTAGQQIAFYQEGYLCGGSTAVVDMGPYCNEMWLKDACQATLMSLLLSLDQIPANKAGAGMILTVLQSIISLALTNGTIEPGKTLNDVQKEFITEIANDPNAWKQVQSLGYWVTAEIQSYVESSITKYKCVYTLIYAKADSVRKVEGTDILE